MAEIPTPEAFQGLFSDADHYEVAGKVFEKDTRPEIRRINEKAQDFIRKKYGGGVFSSIDGIAFSSLVEVWLAGVAELTISAEEDKVMLDIGPDCRIDLPIRPSGLRFITEAFIAGCGLPETFSEMTDPQAGTYLQQGVLEGGGKITVGANYIPDSDAKPVYPSLIVITPPDN